MKKCVFVHTNHRQMVGALVSQYSLKRNSRDPEAFDVRLIDTKDHPFGVWTLPPTLTLGNEDREKYLAIGESDRFTIKFVKPEAGAAE